MVASVDQVSAVAASPIPLGRVLGGAIRIERVVGVGGMAYVYEGRRTSDGARVAVKCLLPSLSHDAVDVTRFLREAESTSRLRSPHVARVYEASSGVADRVPPYFVMEYLEGQDLAAELAARGRFSVAQASLAVVQACAGVAEAHALGIVHRDLKPSNLFRCGRTIKVVDFGIAKSMEAGAGTLTATSDTFGSPSYMSPEQVRSTKSVDARTDVWSMGVVLYELLSGSKPFEGETPGAILAAIVADEPPSLRARAPEVPAALEAIVGRCLVKDRDRRLQSVRELAALLQQVPVPAPPRPRVGAVALALGVPLSVMTGLGGYFVARRYASPAPSALAAPAPLPAPTLSAARLAPPAESLPELALAHSEPVAPKRGAPSATPTTSRFKPCTRNEECGPLEKCYPGGCSCRSGAVRCGDTCRIPGTQPDDCGCGAVCGADHVCSQHGAAPACEHCDPGASTCGGHTCIDLRFTDSHCGACNHACTAGDQCYDGVCIPRVALGGACTPFLNCGTNMHCERDHCACAPGFGPCRGACIVGACAPQ